MFESMFALSSDQEGPVPAPEGDSDENPIRLQGDTTSEFKSLLWALYAMPHEIAISMTPDANCVRLTELARIAHKYQYRSLESFSLAALHNYYSRPNELDSLPAMDESGLNLVALTELASLCERSDLLDLTVTRWRRHLGEGKDVALAISVAERLQLRALLGLAYHSMLLQGREAWESDVLLTRERRIRLLSGHHALGRLWHDLPSQAPQMAHSSRCTAQARCGKAWSSLWRAVLELGPQVVSVQYPDVLGRVMLAESILRGIVSQQVPTPVDDMPFCKDSAVVATSNRLRELRENLADYFPDVF